MRDFFTQRDGKEEYDGVEKVAEEHVAHKGDAECIGIEEPLCALCIPRREEPHRTVGNEKKQQRGGYETEPDGAPVALPVPAEDSD